MLRLSLVGLGLMAASCKAIGIPSGSPAQLASSVVSKTRKAMDNPVCEKLKTDVSVQEEYELGGSVALSWIRLGGGLLLANDQEKQLHQYLNTVGRNLAAQSSRPTLQWTFGILQEPKAVDAISAPGGYVFLTRGLLRELNNEAQLAGVLAHEIAHITLKHALIRYGETKAAQCQMSAIFKMDLLTDTVVESIKANGFDKGDEFIADELAVHLLASAGYDPEEYIRFIANVADSRNVIGNHPRKVDRVKRMVAVLEKAKNSGDGFSEWPAGMQGLVAPALPPVFSVVQAKGP
jgi:beta-barrel assembly-enhancing protease